MASYYYKTSVVIKDIDTGETINTGASVFGKMGGAPGTSTSYQLTVGSTGTVKSVASSASKKYYLNASITSGYTFSKWVCTADDDSSTFTVMTMNSNKNWDLSSLLASHTGSSNPLVMTIELYVKSPTYTITYSPGSYGSGSAQTATKTHGVALTLMGAIFTRSGYTQTGWATSDGGSKAYNLGGSYTTDAAATLYPYWTASTSTYTVSFAKNASDATGSDIPSIPVASGSSVTLPDAELWEREGYAFEGWCLNAACSGTVYDPGDTYAPTGNTTFYAKWASTSASGAMADYDRHQTSSTYQTKVTDQYNLQISSDVGESALLYWDQRLNGKIVVKRSVYDPTQATNPTVTKTTTQTQSAVSRTHASIPAHGSASPFLSVDLPGDSISDWTYNSTKASSEYYTVTETTKTTTFKDTMKLIAPEITNYEFVGWYTLDQSYSSSVGISDAMFTTLVSTEREVSFILDVKSHLNWVCYNNQSGTNYETRQYNNHLRLKYLGVKVIVLFDANGGELDDFYRDVRYNAAYGSLPTPTRTGYTFDGWYTAASGGTAVTASTVVSSASDHTLYAHWSGGGSSETLKLYFDPAGGTCSETSRTVTEGVAYGTLPTPTRSGYTFLGWYTALGTAVTAATVAGDCDTVVYAHWQGAACTVTFDADGGTCSEATRTVYAGSPIGTLPTPTKSGYNFTGWYTSGGTQANASTVVTASITLTAHWSASSTTRVIVRYKIKLTLNGGTLASTYECKYTRGYAKALPTSSEITRSGYTFAGWYAASDFSGDPATTIPATATGTQTFYAKWL